MVQPVEGEPCLPPCEEEGGSWLSWSWERGALLLAHPESRAICTLVLVQEGAFAASFCTPFWRPSSAIGFSAHQLFWGEESVAWLAPLPRQAFRVRVNSGSRRFRAPWSSITQQQASGLCGRSNCVGIWALGRLGVGVGLSLPGGSAPWRLLLILPSCFLCFLCIPPFLFLFGYWVRRVRLEGWHKGRDRLAFGPFRGALVLSPQIVGFILFAHPS